MPELSKHTLTARIVILNYNGKELLPKCIPSISEAARTAKTPTAITVLNNQKGDPAIDYVRDQFPEIEIVDAPKNLILCSYNDYLKQIEEPVAILLNNDIRVDRNFIDPLIEKFKENPKTFLVAPKVMDFSGTRIESASCKAKMKWGIFWSSGRYPGFEKDANTPSQTFSSGFGAFSREKFCELEGYDHLYLPGIFEDADLCYRAAQRGYDLFYEPRSIVYHMGQASFKKTYGSYKIACLAHQNSFLFMWKNFGTKPSFWITHLFFLPLRLFYAVMRGQFAFPHGLIRAIRKKWNLQ